MTPWPFDPLRPLSYDFIMADPAWNFENWSEKGEAKNAKARYDCMTIEQIRALPVGHLAAPDCCMMLWATWPLLPEAIATLEHWGFKYTTGGAWHKKTRHGKSAFGTGYRVRSACEPILFGFIGNPTTNGRSLRNIIEGERREHSRKPDEAYAWAEKYMPHARRLELFSREQRPGWHSWGNEATKFNQEEAA